MQRLFPPAGRELALDEVYRDLSFPDPPPGRPYVILNFVSTLDGQTTLGERGATGIGSRTDHRLMKHLRVTADGLLHGASTVRKDNFAPVVPKELEHDRLARGLAAQPRGAVLSASGNLAPDLRYFSALPPVVFTIAGREEALAASLGERAIVIGAGEDQVDLASALHILRERFEMRIVLCEGGPQLTHSLVATGLVDELFLTLAPKLASDHAASRLLDGPRFAPDALPQLELLHVLRAENELFLRYRLQPGMVRLG